MPTPVNVLVPSYNHGEFIAAAVESVLRQQYESFDVTVVDDGSTDDTLAVLSRFEGRVRVLEVGHAGIAATYNRGLAALSAPYVAVLESDDMWAPDYLSRVVEMMDDLPNLAFLTTGRRIIDRKGNATGKDMVKRSPGTRFTAEGILRYDWDAVSTPVLRTRFLQEIGPYDEKLAFGCDSEMGLRVAMSFEAAYLDEPLYLYRHHGRNTSTDAERTLTEVLQVLNRFSERHPRLPGPVRQALRRRYGRTHARLGKLYFRDPDQPRSRSVEQLRRAVSCTPLRAELYLRLVQAHLAPRPGVSAQNRSR